LKAATTATTTITTTTYYYLLTTCYLSGDASEASIIWSVILHGKYPRIEHYRLVGGYRYSSLIKRGDVKDLDR